MNLSDSIEGGVTRRDFLKTVGAGGLALLATSFPAGITARSAKKKIIRMITEEVDPNTIGVYDRIIKQFTDQHPDVKIEREYIGFGELYQKLMASMATGNPPQLMRLDLEILDLVTKDLLMPVTDVIKEISPGADYLSLMPYVWNGEHLTVPVAGETDAIWYRKDLFEEKGLKPPTSWDDILEAAEALTEGDQYGIVMPMGRSRIGSDFFLEFFWAAGGRVLANKPYNELNQEDILFDGPEARETLEFVKKLYQYSPPGSASYSWGEARSSYYSGEAAMTRYAGRVFAETYQNAPELADVTGIAKIPTPKGRPTKIRSISKSAGWCLAKNSQYPDLCKEFAKALTTGELYIELLHSVPVHNVPPRYSVVESDAFWDHKVYREHPEIERTILDEVWEDGCKGYEYVENPHPQLPIIANKLAFTDMMQEYLIKNSSLDRAIKIAVDGIKSEL